MNVVPPLPPIKSKQPGVTNSLLYSGSRFVGHQKSKGNQYDVEVILQVSERFHVKCENPVSFHVSTCTYIHLYYSMSTLKNAIYVGT